MNILIMILLTLIALFLVGYPFIRGTQSIKPALSGPDEPSVPDREIIMSTLGEIEFDYHMNKLSQDDYQTLKNVYSGAAISILQSEEALHPAIQVSPDLEAEIEAEIEAELQALSHVKTDTNECLFCHTRLQPGQEHCHNCGERQF